MPPVVAEAAAAATAAATGAFNYNRANYFFDQGLRFGRFNTGYSMAMAQASMYREDIRDLTELTVTKQDTYHTVGVIFFVLNFQLIMAGRLGVHGPSPPGWLLGLYWTNISTALMFLVTFTWTAMHASARATAGGAYMLTRNVRLPIPTPKMLDKARVTGNSFEKQRVRDMLRIPFAMPAPKETEEDPETGDRTRPISDRRMPTWYHDEAEELRKDEGGAAPIPGEAPEHFELYRGLQEEWWGYDVYGRIGITYFMSHWLTAASLYSMCHVFAELRCLWPAWSVTAMFVTAHYGILTLDIVHKPREGGCNVPVEKVVPFVPVIAVLGMSIDYSVLEPTVGWQSFIYFLSWICYLIQFAWAIRLYDLAAPARMPKDMQEQPGQPWWPSEWPLPPAFHDAIYMVSAPRYLDPSQSCIQQEMKAAKGQQGFSSPGKKARATGSAMLPWKLFRGACITTISMWALIMCGRAFEQVNGERFLLKQEGRVERWPSHMQPWMAPWSRKGTRNEMCHAGGCDRRLSESQRDVAAIAKRLVVAFGPLAEALDGRAPAAIAPVPPPALEEAKVSFPAGLRPSLLAARGSSQVAALDRTQRRGALVADGAADASSFVLEGIDGLGELMGAVWDEAGLLLTTTGGKLAHCAGSPAASGSWACAPLAAAPLPSGLTAATTARTASGLRAAVIFEGEDTILLMDADQDTGLWIPAGEVHAPMVAAASHGPQLSLAPRGEELIISTADGSVHKRSISSDSLTKKVAAPSASSLGFGKTWHSACSLGGGKVAHLASPSAGGAPELFFAGTAGL